MNQVLVSGHITNCLLYSLVQECQWYQVATNVTLGTFMNHLLASRPIEIVAMDLTMLDNELGKLHIMTDVFSEDTAAVSTWD